MSKRALKTQTKPKEKRSDNYRHPEADSPLRPDVGTQARFKKKMKPQTYRYDSSLSPRMDWDDQAGVRELGEWLLACIEEASALPAPHRFDSERTYRAQDDRIVVTVTGLADCVRELKRLSRPFLNWAGKAERVSFDVPTLPLFVHERLATSAIVETLKTHSKDVNRATGKLAEQTDIFDLFADPRHAVSDQVLRAYEYRDNWVNRMILGDSLVVMNSLLRYEGLGGQVQMIYIDPPYGIKFGSNFQPFVRKRDVKHNDDEDMTREPEMVKAYRDTWELGLHSYLTYLRDRLYLAHDLLHPTGSVFVQISDENVHHVREIMDEVFGAENSMSVITFVKTTSSTGKYLSTVSDYLLWYAKEKERVKYKPLFVDRTQRTLDVSYNWIELPDGKLRRLSKVELSGEDAMPQGRRFSSDHIISQSGGANSAFEFAFEGKIFRPAKNNFWKTNREGLEGLAKANRLIGFENQLRYRRYADDFPFVELTSTWPDTTVGTLSGEKYYVVQTNLKVVQRCLLMTTDPGDLVLDPTCGSGTTAYVAEQWGRRWITIDTSRVPLALARQRVLTATFPWYELRDEKRGPVGGFVYKRKQNRKGEEVGGIVPHITLKSIANNEPPAEEVLVDRPEEQNGIVRVSGPFAVEATIPTPVDWEGDGAEASGAGAAESHIAFVDRMLEVLRHSPVLHLDGNRKVTLHHVRLPAKTLSLSAEAMVDATARNGASLEEAVNEAAEKSGGAMPLSRKPVAIVFGPENGAVSEKLVFEAAKEAEAKRYTHLYVIGFAIQPHARKLVDECEAVTGVPATYVQATPDLVMGDLLKNMRSSQIFSVCGLPEIQVRRLKGKEAAEARVPPLNPPASGGKEGGGKEGGGKESRRYQVELLGFDLFDPATMEVDHRSGDDVPAWFLDTDYNGLCFHVSQAFFPRTGAWESLKKALKATHEESVWDHLAGTKSAPFEGGEHGQVAVKVIDDRGNELMVVKSLKEAKA